MHKPIYIILYFFDVVYSKIGASKNVMISIYKSFLNLYYISSNEIYLELLSLKYISFSV